MSNSLAINEINSTGKNFLENKFLERKDRLVKVAYSILQNKEDAEDAIQETYYRAVKGISQLKNKEYIYTWIYKILINECNKIQNKKRRRIPEDIKECFEVDLARCVESKIFIEEVLKNISEDHRQIVVLKFIEQLSLKEISEILDIPVGTVKSRCFYAIDKIKNNLLKEGVIND